MPWIGFIITKRGFFSSYLSRYLFGLVKFGFFFFVVVYVIFISICVCIGIFFLVLLRFHFKRVEMWKQVFLQLYYPKVLAFKKNWRHFLNFPFLFFLFVSFFSSLDSNCCIKLFRLSSKLLTCDDLKYVYSV